LEGEVTADIVADLSALIDVADPLDLELRPPVGGNPFSADKMEPSASRPSIGVQGRILDAMTSGKITSLQAQSLLYRVRRRLDGPGPGISTVDDNGNLRPINMEVVNGTRP
jgi:hypothetical protein